MTRKLLASTTAIALLAGVSVAAAQSPGGGGPTTGSPPASASPSGSGGAGGSMGGAPGGSMQGETRGGGTMQGETRGSETRGSNETRGSGETRGTQSQDRGPREGGTQQRDGDRGQAQRPEGRDGDMNRAQQGERGDRERTGQRDGQRGERSGETTGAAPSSVSISTEQRTRIRERRSALSAGRAANVNFNISVGTVVPRTVTVHPLPMTIVEIVPEYRGYHYILVEDEILIVEPDTLRIVAIIDA